MEQWVFQPGQPVILHGLVSRPELNDQQGICGQFSPVTARFAVQIGDDTVSVKQANLRPASLHTRKCGRCKRTELDVIFPSSPSTPGANCTNCIQRKREQYAAEKRRRVGAANAPEATRRCSSKAQCPISEFSSDTASTCTRHLRMAKERKAASRAMAVAAENEAPQNITEVPQNLAEVSQNITCVPQNDLDDIVVIEQTPGGSGEAEDESVDASADGLVSALGKLSFENTPGAEQPGESTPGSVPSEISAAEQDKQCGNAAFKRGDIKQAATHYLSALKPVQGGTAELSGVVHANLGQCFLKLAKWGLCLTNCSSAIATEALSAALAQKVHQRRWLAASSLFDETLLLQDHELHAWASSIQACKRLVSKHGLAARNPVGVVTMRATNKNKFWRLVCGLIEAGLPATTLLHDLQTGQFTHNQKFPIASYLVDEIWKYADEASPLDLVNCSTFLDAYLRKQQVPLTITHFDGKGPLDTLLLNMSAWEGHIHSMANTLTKQRDPNHLMINMSQQASCSTSGPMLQRKHDQLGRMRQLLSALYTYGFRSAFTCPGPDTGLSWSIWQEYEAIHGKHDRKRCICGKVVKNHKKSKCGGCHKFVYCSVECQQLHWRTQGHAAECPLGGELFELQLSCQLPSERLVWMHVKSGGLEIETNSKLPDGKQPIRNAPSMAHGTTILQLSMPHGSSQTMFVSNDDRSINCFVDPHCAAFGPLRKLIRTQATCVAKVPARWSSSGKLRAAPRLMGLLDR